MKELQSKLWYFFVEWKVRKCPYNKRVTRASRIALIKEMFNF